MGGFQLIHFAGWGSIEAHDSKRLISAALCSLLEMVARL